MRSACLLLLAFLLFAPLCAAKPARHTAPAEKDRVIAYTAWTSSALYLAFNVEEPIVMGNQTLPLSQPWLDDAVAVYLNLSPRAAGELNKNCVRIVISAAGGATVQRGDNGEWRDDAQWFQPGEQGTIRYSFKVLGKINDTSGKFEGV